MKNLSSIFQVPRFYGIQNHWLYLMIIEAEKVLKQAQLGVPHSEIQVELD